MRDLLQFAKVLRCQLRGLPCRRGSPGLWPSRYALCTLYQVFVSVLVPHMIYPCCLSCINGNFFKQKCISKININVFLEYRERLSCLVVGNNKNPQVFAYLLLIYGQAFLHIFSFE